MTDTTLKVIEATTGGTDLGAISFTQGATPVKAGKQHLVDVAGAAIGVTGNPLAVSDGGGSLTVDGSVSVSGTATVTGTVQANNLVGGTAVSNANPIPVSDAGGSLTVDGTVTANLAAGTNSIGNIGTVTTITNPVSVTDNGGSLTVDGTITANQGTAGASPWPVSDGGGSLTVDGTVSVANFPATQNVAVTGTGTAAGTPFFAQEVVAGSAVSITNPVPTRNIPADLGVQAQSAAAAAVTLTIPAAGAGLFHYIDVIEIHLYATAARTGAAAPVSITSTNLPGNPSWLFPTGQAIGTIDRYAFSGDRPMKSVAANTATTIVAPAVTGGIVQIKVIYSTGP